MISFRPLPRGALASPRRDTRGRMQSERIVFCGLWERGCKEGLNDGEGALWSARSLSPAVYAPLALAAPPQPGAV